MLEVKGKYNTAKVFTDNIEDKAIGQIIELCNQEAFKGSKVRIMPDTHAGAGCVIGFTANMGDKIVPNLIGVDISCGVLSVYLGNIDINLKKLDEIINKYVPSGFNIHNKPLTSLNEITNLRCYKHLSKHENFEKALGSLGGGNHFLELNVDNEGNKYLVIHSGSRNLGKQIADFYQKLAISECNNRVDKITMQTMIDKLKEQGRQKEIPALIKSMNESVEKIPNHLAYLTGTSKDDYLHDMGICQEYAKLNRLTMAKIILEKYFDSKVNLRMMTNAGDWCTQDWHKYDFKYFETVHNYIDLETNIIRKGAVSAKAGERLIIPINMRDGSLICIGKGNEDWNNSAPHGAGRLMSRGEAKRKLSMDDFKDTMKDIYSTSVRQSTIDEAPSAYKNMQEIIDNIQDTVDIVTIIKPIYNFKAH